MSERGDKEAAVDTPGKGAAVDTPEKGAAVEEELSVRMESVKVVQTAVLILDKLRAVSDISATVPVGALCSKGYRRVRYGTTMWYRQHFTFMT
jgi:hypothetical protein